MAMAWDDAIDQVLVRLAEDNASVVAELPAGTGTVSAATISTNTQIATFLDEGQKLLARTPLFALRSTATATIADNALIVSYSAMTPLVAGQVPWRILSATLGSTLLQLCDEKWREVYYPGRTTTGAVVHLFDNGDHATFGPTPGTGNGGTLTVSALMLPRTAAVGSANNDVPDHLMHYVIGFGCFKVCEQNAAEPGFAAMLANYRAEVAAWAGPLIGLGGKK